MERKQIEKKCFYQKPNEMNSQSEINKLHLEI